MNLFNVAKSLNTMHSKPISLIIRMQEEQEPHGSPVCLPLQQRLVEHRTELPPQLLETPTKNQSSKS